VSTSEVGGTGMRKAILEVDKPLLDIVSLSRRGPNGRLTPEEVALVVRTLRRTPEVMVKVSGGASSSAGALAHLKYIDRRGDLEMETDDGSRLQGAGAERSVIEDWELDVLAARSTSPYRGIAGRKPSKLVHNIVLSMPSGTSPTKLLAASRTFAREEFGLKHRYLMVLHTDQEHPHVHLVVKAVSEEGKRLNIRKATLRGWRRDFAAQLRAHGIAANATERAVRGQVLSPKRDGVYRTAQRDDSRRVRERLELIGRDLGTAKPNGDPGSVALKETRRKVVEAWGIVSSQMLVAGHPLADHVWGFLGRMPEPQTEQAVLKNKIRTTMDRERQPKRDERTR
jgi:Relaxase/Mobilisation nuclease domain